MMVTERIITIPPEQFAELRELHRPQPQESDTCGIVEYCDYCMCLWPCVVSGLISEVDERDARVATLEQERDEQSAFIQQYEQWLDAYVPGWRGWAMFGGWLVDKPCTDADAAATPVSEEE